ncbi:pyridine nucleotide-disulfide oxidoreductase domain-containing protein 1-like [Lingula anatina]|uniref:Pyridine nucleotide-disulfide oxidoreductase domain-containing protein 1-like n=1 Tax=Lingula anatina TaxID=7574 RepID=A0A1S3HYV1_LINAN|nr:pyridine nucleotide-disulfide oxidoreductase domain-containing protein 1-like [Lingula anatina]|eukprot:XP_013391183.1 pyridine nucleotide-disulfide oxidoreductase domain-containing protein 1-like [Lingula anatina]
MSGEQLQCEYYPFIVVGGGIAGVTCAETLSLLCPEEKILLISASPLIKAVSNLRQYGRTLQQFDVVEKPLSVLQLDCPNIHVLNTAVKEMDQEEHKLLTVDEKWYRYGKLCICTGGKPKVLMEGNKHVLGIRDTESVQEFQERLSSARRVVIVGNGGIATELVYHIKNCEVVWAIKDASITKTFVDAGAAEFFLSSLSSSAEMKDEGVSKRMKYTLEKPMISRLTPDLLGGALGPDWTEGREMQGQYGEGRSIHVEYKVEVSRLLSQEEMKSSGKQAKKFPKNDETGLSGEASWPIYVELTNGHIYGCDFVVSATGVIPNVYPFNKNKQFVISSDGGLSVNDHMMTCVQDVYAAGDVCSASWEPALHWLQVR